jgi:hypothetical protein
MLGTSMNDAGPYETIVYLVIPATSSTAADENRWQVLCHYLQVCDSICSTQVHGKGLEQKGLEQT